MSKCKEVKNVGPCSLSKPPLKRWLEIGIINKDQYKRLKFAVKQGFEVEMDEYDQIRIKF